MWPSGVEVALLKQGGCKGETRTEVRSTYDCSVHQGTVVPRLTEQPVPRAKRRGDQQLPDDFWPIDEGGELHHERDGDGQPDACGAAASCDRDEDGKSCK